MVGATTLGVPLAAGAQAAVSSDSLPFRAGQYGVEFGLGGSFAALGFLRFQSPEKALLFDVVGAFNRTSGDRVVGISIQPDGERNTFSIPEVATTADATARLGQRRYRALTSRVQRFHTFGVLARVRRSNSETGGFSTTETRSTTLSGGVFGEIGAAYMVTPNLSLGATWNADATYSRTSTRETSGTQGERRDDFTRSQFGLAFGRIGLRGNFYF